MQDFPRGLFGYAPVELIGRGALGLVFKARRCITGHFVAVKTPHLTSTAEANERFRREVLLRASHSHPHIACLIDAGQTASGRPYAISEFVPGETLRQYLLRHGPLEAGLASALMGQLLDALACIHACGIVHRDLNPQNVLITNTGARANVKLIDFGMAARASAADGAPAPVGGTPRYCAPEQLRGEPPTPAADLYVWGLLFVECLSGRPAVPGLDMADVLRSQLNVEPVAFPRSLRGHALEPLLREVLSKNAAERADDAAALYARMQVCLADGARDMTHEPERAGPTAAPNLTTDIIGRAAPVLCLSLLLTPLTHTSMDLTMLTCLQDEQQQCCVQAILSDGGRLIGALCDRLLFHYGDEDTSEGLWRAALGAVELRAEIARRSRLLEIQYGARLDLRVGLHVEDPSPASAEADLNRAANVALHLNRLAGPGAIVASPSALRKLRYVMHFEEFREFGVTLSGEAVSELFADNASPADKAICSPQCIS
jgi:Protein kinase domain